MVKVITLFCALSTNILVNAQVDTLKCEESFSHYDTLLGDNLIVIWETPPSLKKCFQKEIVKLKDFVVEQTSYEYILISMIINSNGIPVCFRFKEELEPEIKAYLTDKLRLMRFNPALQRGQGVESIYTIKI